jgi:hypothetical protein
MKSLLLLAVLIFSPTIFAQRSDPACSEFRYIQRTMHAINTQSVDHVIPYADWLDRKYRREDQISAGKNIAKVVVLTLIGRLNFITFWMMPTRAEAATITGSYVRSPEAYARFLQLTPQRACPILTFGGSDGELLRDVTHEVYLELRRASR